MPGISAPSRARASPAAIVLPPTAACRRKRRRVALRRRRVPAMRPGPVVIEGRFKGDQGSERLVGGSRTAGASDESFAAVRRRDSSGSSSLGGWSASSTRSARPRPSKHAQARRSCAISAIASTIPDAPPLSGCSPSGAPLVTSVQTARRGIPKVGVLLESVSRGGEDSRGNGAPARELRPR